MAAHKITKVEYSAASNVRKDSPFLHDFLGEYIQVLRPIKLNSESRKLKFIASTLVSENHSVNIDPRNRMIPHCKNIIFRLQYVSTGMIVADVMTTGLVKVEWKGFTKITQPDGYLTCTVDLTSDSSIQGCV